MPTTAQGTIWVCVDCLMLHANGEPPVDPQDDQPEPWALWDNAADVTMGLAAEDHDCTDENGDTADDCECEHRSFSWSSCDGCGSTLGGERAAFTYWA